MPRQAKINFLKNSLSIISGYFPSGRGKGREIPSPAAML